MPCHGHCIIFVDSAVCPGYAGAYSIVYGEHDLIKHCDQPPLTTDYIVSGDLHCNRGTYDDNLHTVFDNPCCYVSLFMSLQERPPDCCAISNSGV